MDVRDGWIFMTQEEPDYESYSLSELLSARNFIDRERFPERAARLDDELRKRKPLSQSTSRKRPLRSGTWFILDRTKRGLGLYLVVAGVISVAWLIEGVKELSGDPITLGLLAIPMASYTLMTVGGMLLVRRSRVGLFVSIAALMPQVLILQVDRLTFVLTSVPTLELKLWPEIGFALSTSGTCRLAWHDAIMPFYLGLNLASIIVLGFLSDRVDSLWAAWDRLRLRRGRKAR